MDVQSATTTTSSASSQAQAQGGSSAASASLMKNYESFLTLLTAQLTHQDPTQPMDSAQFTQQLVQYSSVEQSIATNKNLEQLISLSQSSQNAGVVNYIGKTVIADGQNATLSGGKAIWSYSIPDGASQVKLTVTDSNGKEVYSKDGDSTQGSHDFTWDGTNSVGSKAPDGDYKLSVTALDGNAKALTTSTAVAGVVSGVETAGGQSILLVGSRRIPLSSVQTVSVTPATGS